MEMQQIIEMLAKMEADRKADHEMMAKMKAWGGTLDAWSTDTDNGEQTMACQETMEVHLEEEKRASMELKSEVAQQEVQREDAVFMPVGELRKRRRDQRHLAAQRRQKKEQERTQRKDGCRKNLVAARRAAVAWRKINVYRKILTHGYCGLRKEVTAAGKRITRSAGVARRKSNFVKKYPTRDIVEQEIPKRRTEKNKRWKGSECENGVRDRGLKQQVRGNKQTKNPTTNNIEGWNAGEPTPLGSGGTCKKDIRDIFREKIMEHVVGISSGLRRRKKWILWRGRPPPKRKNKQH
jgi:hypothetical protein